MLTLSVCSLKGGVGKTSVTLGLASAALHQKVPTLVIDADPQGDSTLGLLGELADRHDLASVLVEASEESLSAAIRPAPWAQDEDSRLDVLPGSHRSARLDSPRPQAKAVGRLREALAELEDAYDLVIIDCPPSLNGLTQMSLSAADFGMVVAEPGFFSVSAADRALKLISELNETGLAPDLMPLGIVVNRYRPRSVEHGYRVSEMRDLFGDLLLEPVIEERVGLQQAQGASVPLHKYEGASGPALTDQFDNLLQTVLAAGRELRPESVRND